jgi:hypothetical protein
VFGPFKDPQEEDFACRVDAYVRRAREENKILSKEHVRELKFELLVMAKDSRLPPETALRIIDEKLCPDRESLPEQIETPKENSIPASGSRLVSSDLDDLYRRVINRDTLLKKLVELKAPDQIIRDETLMLREAYDALISREEKLSIQTALAALSDNVKRGPTPVTAGSIEVLDIIHIARGNEPATIELCVGDLTTLAAGDSVDVLVVSAYPDVYGPLPGSLIGALDNKGISVGQLATQKEVDLRHVFSCWMSREVLNPAAGIHFRRILCYEPLYRGTPAMQVGDIFRSLAPFVGGSPPVRTVAMPLVATGYQGVPADQMLRLIVDAAAHWMSVGLPLTRLKIACLPGPNVESLRDTFGELKGIYSKPVSSALPLYKYHIFLSYAHANAVEVAWLEQQLLEHKPDLRLFVDRKDLNAGSAWQQEIFESLDDCEKVLAVYSPAYLASKVCLEEFNIALCRHREASKPVLAPLYLYSAGLPTYMKIIQYWDCREFNRAAILRVVGELAGGF